MPCCPRGVWFLKTCFNLTNLQQELKSVTYHSIELPRLTLVESLASNHFVLPCLTGEGKRVACVRGQCEIGSANDFPTWEAKNFMNQFCCHPQHVVQCVL